MESLELLGSFLEQASKKRERSQPKPNLEDDISDITFMLHWFPQFTLAELLDMPLAKFNALLKNGKADYYNEQLQNLVTLSHAQGDKKQGEDYAKKLMNEIKRLRQ